jgi:hypothetical protein
VRAPGLEIHERDPSGLIHELVIDASPESGCSLRVLERERRSSLHLAVKAQITKVAVAVSTIAAEELRNIGGRGGVFGERVTIDGQLDAVGRVGPRNSVRLNLGRRRL